MHGSADTTRQECGFEAVSLRESQAHRVESTFSARELPESGDTENALDETRVCTPEAMVDSQSWAIH
jgi:hypothetical protein